MYVLKRRLKFGSGFLASHVKMQMFLFLLSFTKLSAKNNLFFSDGVVTKEEMKAYFLKANYRALGRDFIHNFQETTYLAPNFCEHCGGMVSLYVKFGFICFYDTV